MKDVDSPINIGKGYKYICISYKCSPNVVSAEEDFHNQLNMLTSSVNCSQLVTSVTPLSAQWAQSRVGMLAGMEVIHAQ